MSGRATGFEPSPVVEAGRRLGSSDAVALDTAPHDPAAVPTAGKALAVWLFNVGARTEAETADAFGAHPEWRNA